MTEVLTSPSRSLPRPGSRSLSLGVARLILGRSFASALDGMERAQWMSRSEIDERTSARLAELLEHASTTVPFYRSHLRLDARPTKNTARTDLASFPVVTKHDLRSAGLDEFVSDALPAHRRLGRTTSGSSGDPFRIFLDRAALPVVFASHIFYDQWCGLAVGERYIRLVAPTADYDDADGAGPHAYRFRQRLARRLRERYERRTQRRTWVGDVDPEAAERFRAEIEAFEPAYLLGYTSTLAAVSAELLRRDRPLNRRPRGVITIAELLTPERRHLIEHYFRAPIWNRYGLREFGWWAGQNCSSSPDSLHLNTELLVCEVLTSDDSPARAGELGRVVLTDLHNRAMPLIRYDTGDLAVAETGSCACGRTFPLITIVGRAHESFRSASRRFVTPGHLGAALSESGAADSQYQLVQEAPDRVRLVVVPGDVLADATRAQLQRAVESVVGGDVQVSVETADRISPERSGKRPTIKPSAIA
jgi:phenylacetate-coenzyme A ligase PaaK-like adenylate-forming protein